MNCIIPQPRLRNDEAGKIFIFVKEVPKKVLFVGLRDCEWGFCTELQIHPEDFPRGNSLLNLFLTIHRLYIEIKQTKTKRDE